jgi:hypothetical protein
MIVRGTPITSYLFDRWGNSTASIIWAVIRSLSSASWYASNTAGGQYGQVGVIKTWILTGLVSWATIFFVSAERPDLPADTSLMLSIRLPNS